ncbi:MAG: HAMP domain-containing protein, partial [Spirochaetota bacterium]|nr:HAMP domain-containing protein [Spirochaetota bacterium]
MVIKNLKSTYKKLILISFYFIIAAILWKIFEEILIFIFSILIFLFYIVIYKIFKLIQFRIKKVPGAGINLKLTLAFISITSIPLFVMVFLTFDLTNQFIESAFHQPFGQYLERLKTLSTEKLSKDFNNYIKIISNTIDIDGINLNKRNYNIEKRFHNFVNFNLIDFYIFFYYNHNKIIISSNRLKINPIKEIENNYKRYLNGDLKRQFFKMLDDKNLFNKKISMIDDKLQINYYIKIVNKEKNHYLFLAKYINPIDLEMAENIKFFYGSYHLKEFNKEQAISNFKWIIFLVGAPTLIVALLFSFFLARSLLKPIESLIIGTKEVANGNLSYKIKELKRGELGELIHSFNYMTHELLKNKRQLYYIEKVAAWREVAKRLAH